jgi:hypothetical protein
MPNELPQVIWESEHKGGTRFRIVRSHRANARVGDEAFDHTLEASRSDEVDAMGVRVWRNSDECKQAVVEVLLAALLRELPS